MSEYKDLYGYSIPKAADELLNHIGDEAIGESLDKIYFSRNGKIESTDIKVPKLEDRHDELKALKELRKIVYHHTFTSYGKLAISVHSDMLMAVIHLASLYTESFKQNYKEGFQDGYQTALKSKEVDA